MTPPNQHTQDSDGIRHIEDKLDTLIDSLPKTYVAQAEVERRFSAMEKILAAIQGQIDMWAGVYRTEKTWAATEHQSIHTAIGEAERRIMAELKDNTKTTQESARAAKSNRLTLWLCIGGWIVTVLLFIASVILAHFLPVH